VPDDDTPYQGKTDTRPLGVGVQSLEQTEDFLMIRRGNAETIILDK
jgi:hypothetical protein